MIRFGTDGIRGTAGAAPITAETGVRVGRAAVRLARQLGGDRVMISRDTRPSGMMLEHAVAAGVSAAGGQAILAGILPTSGLMANLKDGAAEVGVMLTASHNPVQDNGFKVIGSAGRKLNDAAIAQFEEWIGQGPMEMEPGAIHLRSLASTNTYLRELAEACPQQDQIRGAKIAIDLANGAGTVVMRWLQEHYSGVDWVVVGADGGKINDGVGSEHPDLLSQTVVEHGCMAGFAVDGDADRCILVDERGERVSGDALAWFFAKSMRLKRLAVTIMSNGGLELALPEVQIFRTAVGDRHLQEAMLTSHIAVGCEESGHVLFSDGLPGGDGFVTGLRALALLQNSTEPVSTQMSGFDALSRQKGNLPISHRVPLESSNELRGAQEAGLKRLGDGGTILLRYSGTESCLRIMVEGKNQATVRSVYEDVSNVAKGVLS